MTRLDTGLRIPDFWQQEALMALREGRDVVLRAPTGAGKTYVFEMLTETRLHGQAVYTVPTRALANDKLREWRAQGRRVGIATGDVTEDPDAPVIVATLETQRGRFLEGRRPALLVVDEFQMLGDPRRGVNYELVLALAGPETQLLLMSGSVSNPGTVAEWLRSLGRDVALVEQDRRPVPLDEVALDKLPDRVPSGVRGDIVRRIARALLADFGPILVFAPRRRVAEELARALSSAMPLNDFLPLTPEQKRLAGDRLGKMLRNRIAFHHSGLSYEQRAGLVEPLAKAGQLRVVVATTGLASGINFSMRSVFVIDRGYRAGVEEREVRPDELLQMFGRAGRRGLDERGFILFAGDSPRLPEAKPLALKRTDRLDWAGYLAVMHAAASCGGDPIAAAEDLAKRMFSKEPVRLGLGKLPEYAARTGDAAPLRTVRVTRMTGLHGARERLKPESKAALGDAWLRIGDTWHPALTRPEALATVPVGSVCKLPGRPVRYGRLVTLARFPKENGKHRFDLAPWLHRALRDRAGRGEPAPGHRSLEWFERTLPAMLPTLTGGGALHGELFTANDALMARLDYAAALVRVRVDEGRHPLINPVLGEDDVEDIDLRGTASGAQSGSGSPADIWFRLGLLDVTGKPTRRGAVAGFFQQSEGLAIAAALEDGSYAIRDLIRDLANLRAGHRFENVANAGNRLGAVCRLTYRGMTCPGYLSEGVPPDYGDGASELLAKLESNPAAVEQFTDDSLRRGDIERAAIEWRSLLNHVVHAPDLDWDRWMRLKSAAREFIDRHPARPVSAGLPALPGSQLGRHSARTRFDR